MAEQTIETRTLMISEVNAQFSALVNEVSRGKSRILIEEDGVPIAALVGTEDVRQLERVDAEDREAWAVLEAMRAPFRDVPLAEIEREIAKAMREVRAERRAEREAAAVNR